MKSDTGLLPVIKNVGAFFVFLTMAMMCGKRVDRECVAVKTISRGQFHFYFFYPRKSHFTCSSNTDKVFVIEYNYM